MPDERTDATTGAPATTVRGQFVARPTGHVDCCSCFESLNPSKLRVERTRRMLASGDGEHEIVAAWMVCPSCNRRGVLKVASGDYLTDGDLAVLPHLEISLN